MKHQFRRLFLSFCALIGLSVLFAPPAYAYIDAGTTAYLVQILAGVCITCGVVLGVFWKKIRLFFRGKKLAAMEKSIAREAEKKDSF